MDEELTMQKATKRWQLFVWSAQLSAAKVESQ